jgi:hypothetical protein
MTPIIPNLPDNFHKIIVTIGIIISSIVAFKMTESDDESNKRWLSRSELVDSLSIAKQKANFIEEDLMDYDTFIAKKLSIDPQISVRDSGNTLTFHYTISGDSVKVEARDSLMPMWRQWIEAHRTIDVKDKMIDMFDETTKEIDKDDTMKAVSYILYLFLGIGLTGWGLFNLKNQQHFEQYILKRQNLHLPEYFNRCQSCAKNFSSTLGYGTEVNGSTNYAFCVDCYKTGKYTEPQLEFTEQLKRTQEEIRELSKKRQSEIIDALAFCERWKKDKY